MFTRRLVGVDDKAIGDGVGAGELGGGSRGKWSHRGLELVHFTSEGLGTGGGE